MFAVFIDGKACKDQRRAEPDSGADNLVVEPGANEQRGDRRDQRDQGDTFRLELLQQEKVQLQNN